MESYRFCYFNINFSNLLNKNNTFNKFLYLIFHIIKTNYAKNYYYIFNANF